MSHTHQIFTDYDLSEQNTMALGCVAAHAVELYDTACLADLKLDTPFFVLSGGSNVLLPARLEATVLLPKFRGIRLIEQSSDSIIIEVAGGENWHDLVTHCTQNGWYGLENLALIPGLVGASPVQNIGAYGVQLEDVLDSVIAFEWATQQFVTLGKDACKFRYRHSIFKTQPNRYLITAVRLCLHTDAKKVQTGYGDLHAHAKMLAAADHRDSITPRDVYHAVIAIRQSKLPDPKDLPNCGSFFQNPIIPKAQFEQFSQNFPNLPHYPVDDTQVKVPAGWLIDKAGLKGGGIAPILTHAKQALVLTNHAKHTATQADILATQRFIIDSVAAKFGITLEPEPVWVNADGSYR